MICELYNKIEKCGSLTFNLRPQYKDAVNLKEALLQFIYFITIILFVVWWLLPLRELSKYMNNVTFKCDKDKIRGK